MAKVDVGGTLALAQLGASVLEAVRESKLLRKRPGRRRAKKKAKGKKVKLKKKAIPPGLAEDQELEE